MLDARKERLAELIAAGRSTRAAAKELGISEKTARAWLALPGMADRVAALSREMCGQAVAVLSRTLTAASATLARLLDEETPPTVRLGAARAVISSYIELKQFNDLADEVARLRADVEKIGRDRAPGYGRTA